MSVVAVAAAIVTASPADAVWFWGTKPVGMGTAFTGVADDNNAIQINPAGIAMIQSYSLDVEYERRECEILDYEQLHRDDIEPLEEEDDFNNQFFTDDTSNIDQHEKNISDFWHMSIVDGKTTKAVAAGISFTAANFPNRTFAEGKDYQASVALAGGAADIFFIGASGKYRQLEPGSSNFNMDAGVLIKAIDYFAIGLAGRNLFGGPDPYLIEREFSIGLAGFVLDYATVSFDATKIFDVDEPNTFNFALGAEGFVYRYRSMTKAGLALRGGFNWDQIYDRDRYGAGIAWYAPEGTLGYSFRGDVENPKNFSHMLMINMNF